MQSFEGMPVAHQPAIPMPGEQLRALAVLLAATASERIQYAGTARNRHLAGPD